MKKVLQSVGLVVISLVVAAALMELLLRLLGISYPLFTQADPWTGFALRPGAEGWQTDEGRAYVKINSMGMRDREHAKGKPEGTFRVAVLGDSFAEARQVSREKTFWSLMERELQECSSNGKAIEVLNFGVSGFGTAQQLIQLRRRVWDYHPDLVLLAFTTGNDVRNNSAALEGSGDKPYFRLEDGKLQLDASFRERPSFRRQTSALSSFKQRLHARSRILQLLHRTAGTLRKSAAGNAGGAALGSEAGLDDAIYTEPTTPEWRNAWAVTEKLLATMREETRGHGVPFVVATLSNGIQVNPDVAARDAFAKKFGARGLFYPEQRLEAIGARSGFSVLALGPALAKIAEKEKMFLHGFSNTALGEGHWNEDGHREAAKLLSQLLCAGGYF